MSIEGSERGSSALPFVTGMVRRRLWRRIVWTQLMAGLTVVCALQSNLSTWIDLSARSLKPDDKPLGH
jgi:hypothetical protein